MKITIEDEADERVAEAIATAVSTHLGQQVTIVTDNGDVVAGDGDTEADYDGVIVTKREERLREDISTILEGGPERGFKRIQELGKLFVRDRLELIFDEVTYEDGTFASYDRDEQLPADGVVTGVGTIHGREVFFTANDYTVKAGSGGAIGNEKIIRTMQRAQRANAPILNLIDSTGARLSPEERSEGETHADRYTGGKSFFRQSRNSGQIPQIGVLYGPDIAGSAYTPVFCDFLIMVKQIGAMAIASPRIVEAMTGEEASMEELGGWRVHAEHSGSVDIVVDSEKAAAERVRQLLTYLPQNYAAELPDRDPRPAERNPRSLDAVFPEDTTSPYDVHEVIDHIVDRDTWYELKPRFAPELVTGFARIDGQTVGIVANQPDTASGAIFPDSAEKGAGFVWICDAFGIPLVFLCDTPGFMIGSQVEREGILQKGRKMIFATSNAQVPKFCVITRKAYGAGIFAMCGPAFEPDSTLAFPTTEIAVMGPEAAVQAMFAKEIAGIGDEEERQEFIEEMKDEYRKDIRKQASKLQVDELIPAGDLRVQLSARLAAYQDKGREDPDRYHGSILF